MAEKILFAYECKDKSAKPLIKQITPDYQVYQLTPDRFIESGKACEEILTTITALPSKTTRIENKCIVIDKFQPIYYEIYFDKTSVSFNYAIPTIYDKVLRNKIQNVFKSATIKSREDYFHQFHNQYYCNYIQDKHFMFSLDCDYRENGLIEAFLGMADNMLDDDKLLLQIGIQPANDILWKQEWENTYKKYKDGEKIQAFQNIPTAIIETTFNIADGAVGLCDALIGVKPSEKDKLNMRGFNENRNRISHESQSKKTLNGYVTQIRLFCTNPVNTYYYMQTIGGILKLLDGDNSLKMQKAKINKKLDRSFDYQITKNILSQKELNYFLQMPNRRMQMDFKTVLQSIEMRETEIPKELLDKKGIVIGDYVYKGEHQTTYFPSDKDNSNYSLLLTGQQRVGKTTAMVRYAIDSTMKGHSSFIVDTIQGCDLSNRIRDYMPEKFKDKIVVLDLSNLDYLIPLAWNETLYDDSNKQDKKTQLMKASMLAGAFEAFINVFSNRPEELLTSNMSKHLSSACKVVMSQKGTNINDILLCLQDYTKRHEFINNSNMKQSTMTIQDLLSLDKQDANGNWITDYKQIDGIMSRISVLTNDYIMELMLGVPVNENLNFKYWADNGYCVLLKIPEATFSSVATNALVTFMFCKIWLSLLGRNRDIIESYSPVHIIADEIHKFPLVTKVLGDWIRESAKYRANFVISAHSLMDLKSLLPKFNASGANYQVYKTSSQNLKMLEKEIFPYEIDELLEIKPFHTLNIITYNNGDCTKFITKLLPPVEKEFPKVDRKYLDLEFSKKLGFEFIE